MIKIKKAVLLFLFCLIFIELFANIDKTSYRKKPPSYTKEFLEWLTTGKKSKELPSYYNYPHSNEISDLEHAQYNEIFYGWLRGEFSIYHLPASYQFAGMDMSWVEGKRNETLVIAFSDVYLPGVENNSTTKNNINSTHKLIVHATPISGGEISLDGNDWYPSAIKQTNEQDSILLHAKENPDYIFTGWTQNGLTLSKENPFKLKLNSYTEIEAKFSKQAKIFILNGTASVTNNKEIKIIAENLSNVSSFEMIIHFDEEFLSINTKDTNNVKFLEPIADYKLFKFKIKETNELIISGGSLDHRPENILNQEIISLNFKIKNKIGTTVITLSDKSRVFDQVYRDIDFISENGVFTIK